MKIKYFTFLMALLSSQVLAQKYTSNEFKDLFLASLSYHAVARVCGDSESIEASKNTLRRVIDFGERKGLLYDDAYYYIKHPDEVISRGEAQYRKDRYVGCSQAKQIINQLSEATKRLP